MRSSRSFGTVALLSLALVLVAVLAYQAQDAARSHRRIAESTLSDYASFADWQLTQQAKNGLLETVITSLFSPASQVDPKRVEATVLPPEKVGELAQTHADSWCRCLGGVQYFFRYDWSDGTFRTAATDLPDGALAWARDTIAAYARSLPPSNGSRPTTFGSPDGRSGPFTELAVLLTNDSYGMIFGEPPIPKRVGVGGARGSAAKVKEEAAT